MIAIFNVFILICIIINIFGTKIRRKKEKEAELKKQGLLDIDDDKPVTLRDIIENPNIQNIPWSDISKENRIGSGASGLVWSAKWHRLI